MRKACRNVRGIYEKTPHTAEVKSLFHDIMQLYVCKNCNNTYATLAKYHWLNIIGC